jgi:hypothetical protein
MSDTETATTDLIQFVDRWLEENDWRLDQHTIDFALDVRLLAATQRERIPSAA